MTEPVLNKQPKDGDTSATPQTSEATTGGFFPAAKLGAITRFKSLRGTLSRAGSTKEKKVFPPATWSLDQTKDAGTGASSWSYDPEHWKNEVVMLKDQIKEEERQKEGEVKQGDTRSPEAEPMTLARRIQGLIDSLPIVGTAPSTPALERSQSDDDLARHLATTSARPQNPGVDPKLAHLLASDEVMKGEGEKGGQSIWSILERLGPGKREEMREDLEEVGDGVMMYAPLHPTPDSQVELADSDMVLEYIDDEPDCASQGASDTKTGPSDSKGSDSKGGQNQSTSDLPAPAKTKTRREWHPSPTKLSLQVMWWGYRLYLPPPVLDMLSDSQVTAAKRGALVTAALKWLLDKVPMMVVPPPFRPALMVLKRLTPYLGYLGAFVAWSWGNIKKHDKGNGVILTATWLLSVAVIPSTWDVEVHGHPKPPFPERKPEVIPDAVPEAAPSTSKSTWGFLTREKSTKGK